MKIKKIVFIGVLGILLCFNLLSYVIAKEQIDNSVSNNNSVIDKTMQIEDSVSNENISINEVTKIENNISDENNIINETTETQSTNDNNGKNNVNKQNDIDKSKKQNDNDKVDSKIKDLLKQKNVNDVNELSTMVTSDQMQKLISKFTTVSQNKALSGELSGIWLDANSENIISTLANNQGCYTYSVDKKGYLLSDKTLRNNERLDMVEPSETAIDMNINDVLNSNSFFIVKVSDGYYGFTDKNQIQEIKFGDNEYSKAYEFDNIRMLILNSKYYNMNNINDINASMVLEDNFINTLCNIPYKVLIGEIKLKDDGYRPQKSSKAGLLRSFTDNGQAIGINNATSQIVYSGPNNNGAYCTVGSIDAFEQVAILGQESRILSHFVFSRKW